MLMPLDLGSSESVKLFVQTFRQRYHRLDGLILSAGLNSSGASIQHADVFQARSISHAFMDRFQLPNRTDNRCFHALITNPLTTLPQVNFTSHFLLCHMLLEDLRRSGTPSSPARVVCLSSVMHTTVAPPHDWSKTHKGAYAYSKLALHLLATELDRREAPVVRAFAVNPGAVNSDIWRASSVSSLLDTTDRPRMYPLSQISD